MQRKRRYPTSAAVEAAQADAERHFLKDNVRSLARIGLRTTTKVEQVVADQERYGAILTAARQSCSNPRNAGKPPRRTLESGALRCRLRRPNNNKQRAQRE